MPSETLTERQGVQSFIIFPVLKRSRGAKKMTNGKIMTETS